jgi:uncharacterized protein YkwD
MKFTIFILLILCISPSKHTVLDEWTSEENELYELIMDYRARKGLDRIEKSKSLHQVAKMHCEDLEKYGADEGRCNLHSWSKNGNWDSCCYTDDHKKASCMWDKPREMTSYTGNGYEIAHWHSSGATPKSAFEGWKESTGHDKVMLNKGVWKDEWKAIGVGIYKGYACVWFGNEVDGTN